ncbi:MAG: FxsA family protein [Candidatus Loosdrechtia sp.]|uniref:FxsA family protein n=1 Tax=Candidatus Loosdrechtia sp. TaxID=3101272 RepID=UPI003A6726C1|nr:MAG: FxsA family protein [Candidatus Jettenia sp. AMX2]
MVLRLILLFTIFPLVELYLLIQIGRHLGALTTVMIVFITGVAGALLAKSQGLSVYKNIKKDLQEGFIPTESLLDGLFILIAGALLITPGLITDIVGFFLMIPLFRRYLKIQLAKKFHQKYKIKKTYFSQDL